MEMCPQRLKPGLLSIDYVRAEWPVVGFEATRIYYLLEKDTLNVIRILHGKRDVKRIVEGETIA